MNEINSNLLKLRNESGHSQQEVADYLGITRQAYSHYEVGRRKPDYETLLKLAEYFGCSALDILGAEKPDTDSAELDRQLQGIDFALFGEVKDLTDAQKRDVLQFVQFIKNKEKA